MYVTMHSCEYLLSHTCTIYNIICTLYTAAPDDTIQYATILVEIFVNVPPTQKDKETVISAVTHAIDTYIVKQQALTEDGGKNVRYTVRTHLCMYYIVGF